MRYSRPQKTPLWFLNKHKDIIDWHYISRTGSISETSIKKFISKINLKELSDNNNVPDSIRKKFCKTYYKPLEKPIKHVPYDKIPKYSIEKFIYNIKKLMHEEINLPYLDHLWTTSPVPMPIYDDSHLQLELDFVESI